MKGTGRGSGLSRAELRLTFPEKVDRDDLGSPAGGKQMIGTSCGERQETESRPVEAAYRFILGAGLKQDLVP